MESPLDEEGVLSMISIPLIMVQLISGLANAMFLFLIASGLSLIFGVTRIVNFSHGSFYMLGGYIAYSITKALNFTELGFWIGLIFSPLGIAFLGWAMERFILRKIYDAHEILQLLLTFGIVLIAGDIVRGIWGMDTKSISIPSPLSGSIQFFGQPFPTYYLIVICLGPIISIWLWWIFYRTRWGIMVRAATEDREMVSALGIDQTKLFNTVFVFGSFLAGLGGTLSAPIVGLSPGMDMTVIVEAFVVVVVGGMGSFTGSIIAAMMIGILKSFGILVFPGISLILIFAFMAIVLVIRPWGILGRPIDIEQKASFYSTSGISQWGNWQWLICAFIAIFIIFLPFIASRFWLIIATEILAFGLFAQSLNLLTGYGGMISFGHAAYFGLGAYCASLLFLKGGLPMLASFGTAPFLAAFSALLFGFLSMRLSSIYFAMLTLAFAQILYTIAFQWYDFTGGDNGLLGIWPSDILGSPLRYYYFSLAIFISSLFIIFIVIRSPFGATITAIRDNPKRAESIGISLGFHRVVALVISGFFAGLAGAIFVFQKGSVFPDYLFVVKSIEPLVMILIGGMASFSGPVIGSIIFKLLDTVITSATEYWQGFLGIVLIILVLIFPRGISGYINKVLISKRRTNDTFHPS
jgi:branched-chain amino acid transport system permease protein